MSPSLFWLNVKSRLSQLSMTQEVLAEKVGFSYSLLKKWISMGTIPEAYRVVAIARVLGSTAEQLMGPETVQVNSFLFGDRLRESIVSSNRNTIDLARLTGIPEDQLESWSLMHDPPLDALRLSKLADKLNVSAAFLCGLTSGTVPEEILAVKFPALSPNEQKLVLEFAQLLIDRQPKK